MTHKMLVHSIFSVSSTGSYKEEEKASETIAKYFEVSFRERLHMANGGERWYTGKGSQLPLMQYARISGLLLVRFSSFRSFIFFRLVFLINCVCVVDGIHKISTYLYRIIGHLVVSFESIMIWHPVRLQLVHLQFGLGHMIETQIHGMLLQMVLYLWCRWYFVSNECDDVSPKCRIPHRPHK